MVGIGTTSPTYKLELAGSGSLFRIADSLNNTLVDITDVNAQFNLPTTFTSTGDVSMANNLIFTNPLASYINSAAPLYLQAGESFNSSDLTLRTYNAGQVIVDSSALNVGGTFILSQGASNGYILQTDASGNASWVPASGTGIGTTYSAGVGLTLSNLNVFSLDLASTNTWTGVQTFQNNFNVGSSALITNLNANYLNGIPSTGFLQVGGTGFFNTATNGLQAIGNTGIGLGGTLTQANFTNINIGTGSSGLAILGLNNNTQALVILQNGNVGIGTTSPSYKLDVTGEIYSSGTSGVSYWIPNGKAIRTGSTGTTVYMDVGDLWVRNGNGAWNSGGSVRAYGMALGSYANGSSISNGLFITPGNVGIGTTSPASLLDVNGTGWIRGTAAGTGGLAVNSSGNIGIGHVNQYGYQVETTGNAYFGNTITLGNGINANNSYIDNVSTLYVTGAASSYFSTGNVGIGTTGPADKLHVVGGNIRLEDNSAYYLLKRADAVQPLIKITRSDDTAVGLFRTNGWGNFTFDRGIGIGYDLSGATNANGLLVNGNVGIGTTSPSQKLDVNGSVNIGGSLAIGTQIYAPSLTVGTGTSVVYINASTGQLTEGLLGPYDNYQSWALAASLGTAQVISAGNTASFLGFNGIGTSISGTDQIKIGLGGTLTQANFTNINIGTGSSGLAILGLNNNTQALVILQNGNVGIGTTAPISKLNVGREVKDDSAYAYDPDSVTIVHQTATSTTVLNDPQTVLMLSRQGTSAQAYGAAATFNLSRFENSSTNSRTKLEIGLANASFDAKNSVMTLLSTGNVGIGTTSPGAKLDVIGNIQSYTTDPKLYLQDSSVAWEIGQVSANNRFRINNVSDGRESLTILRAGNVGIGTTSPIYKLDLASVDTGTIGNAHIMGAGSNLIKDGSFEMAGTAFSNFSGFGCGGGDSMTATYPTGDSPAGGKVLQVSTTQTGNYCNIWGTNEYIAVQPNTKYTYSFWAKLISGTPDATNLMYIQEYTAGLGNTANGGIMPGQLTSGSWQHYSRTFTTTASTNYVKLLAYIYTSTVIQFDGLSLQKGTVSTEYTYSPYDIPDKAIGYGDIYINGKIGIGTTSPTYTLHVGGTGSLGVGGSVTFTGIPLGTGTTILYINSSGVLTQGTLPASTSYTADNGLHLSGSIFGLGGTLTDTNFTNINIGTGSSGLAILGLNNNTQALVIRQNGYVGIGTTNPTTKLSVYGDVGAAGNLVNFQTNHGNLAFGSTSGGMSIYNTTNTALRFGTNDTERWQITNTGILQSVGTQTIQTSTGNLTLATAAGNGHIILSPNGTGNVGIGTTNPGAKLDVNGGINVAASNWVTFGNSGPGGSAAGFTWNLTNDAASMYASEVSADQTDYVFKMADNTTGDRFVWWIQDYQGAAYDVYPMVLAGNYGNFYNGRLYINNSTGNVGIGTTAPGSSLDVIGAIRASIGVTAPKITLTTGANAGYILSSDASGNSSWVAPSSVGGTITANNGIGFSGTTLQLGGALIKDTRLNIGSTEVMFFQQSTGNVGIGTTNPVSKLAVAGTTGISWGPVNAGVLNGLVTIGDSGTSGGSLVVRTNSLQAVDPSGLGIDGTYAGAGQSIVNIKAYGVDYAGYGSVLTLSTTKDTNLNERMRIDSNGNVGIGTTSPLLPLHTYVSYSDSHVGVPSTSGTVAKGISAFEWAGEGLMVGFNNNAPYGAWLQAQHMTDASITRPISLQPNGGNVGIGTTNPLYKLDIQNNGPQMAIRSMTDGGGRAIAYVGGSTTYNWLAGGQYNVNNAFEITPSTTTGGTTFSTPALTILNNGNVGIGTTNPAQKLDVVGAIRTSIGLTSPALTLTASGYGAGKILQSDASGNASWVTASGTGIGTTYSAGSGLSLASNVFSLNVANANTWTGLQTFNATGAPFAVGSSTLVTNLNADLLDGQNGTYYDQRRYTDATNYLGGYYVSGGLEKPNDTIFGAGKLKLAMLSGGNLGFGGSWNDVLWFSGYTGSDVKSSYALVGDKYSDNLYFSRQNHDSATWGTSGIESL